MALITTGKAMIPALNPTQHADVSRPAAPCRLQKHLVANVRHSAKSPPATFHMAALSDCRGRSPRSTQGTIQKQVVQIGPPLLGTLRFTYRDPVGRHPHADPGARGHPGFDLATPLPRCRACVRRSAPRGDRATCGSGTGSPRPARSVDIRPPTRGATSAPARCDLQTPGPRQAPPNAPYARHESRCAGHGAERRGHA
jgi:hypothetical protein